ncbi:hypothetical protein, partial [Klebsiella grimontii]|uniref:hypothetical protein n=1 Tax=Klebsiella grimontii TaxID=2058152 RepID=UPI001D0E0D67
SIEFLAIFNLVFINRLSPFLFQSMPGFVLSTSPVALLDSVMVKGAFQCARARAKRIIFPVKLR